MMKGEKCMNCLLCGEPTKIKGPRTKYCKECADKLRKIRARRQAEKKRMASGKPVVRVSGSDTSLPDDMKNICMKFDCMYHTRGKNISNGTCEYILIEDHSRGCSIENCNKYRIGKVKRKMLIV